MNFKSTLCYVVREQNKQGIAAHNFINSLI